MTHKNISLWQAQHLTLYMPRSEVDWIASITTAFWFHKVFFQNLSCDGLVLE